MNKLVTLLAGERVVRYSCLRYSAKKEKKMYQLAMSPKNAQKTKK